MIYNLWYDSHLSLLLMLAMLLAGCGGAPTHAPLATPERPYKRGDERAGELPTLVATATTHAATPLPAATIGVKAAELRGTTSCSGSRRGATWKRNTTRRWPNSTAPTCGASRRKGARFPAAPNLKISFWQTKKPAGCRRRRRRRPKWSPVGAGRAGWLPRWMVICGMRNGG